MSVLARVPVARIRTEAERVQWGRAILTALVGVLYGIGWVVGKTVRWTLAAVTFVLYGIGRVLGWSYAAIRLGWQDAQPARAGR